MKYIDIANDQVDKISVNRLLNIYKRNRKYLFQILAEFGFDTSEGRKNINYSVVNDDLYFHKPFNRITALNNRIKYRLDKENKL
jgi:hypothetical protein